jgi:hypothetical protein
MKIGAGANVFLTKALSGVTGMTIVGTSADDDQVSISTTTSDASINLSGVTYDATVDESTIDLGHNKADTAFVGTISNIADTVVGVDGNTKAFTLNLGAGDDEIMLGDNAGTLTLGVGKDNIMLTTGATTSTAGDMVSVADFTLADDKITKVAADIGADKVVDVSGESDDTATDIVANALNGVITISGTHATQIDTLAEWVKVVLAVSGADTAADEVYAFQYNGNTYVTETKGGTGSAEEVTIELTGVTGITALGVAAAAHTIVIA